MPRRFQFSLKREEADDLVVKIDRAIAVLTETPASHLGQDWGKPQVENWLKVFGDLRTSVLAGRRPEHVTYVRGLDMCVPCCSELCNAVCDIDVAIGKINKRR